jgi:hypothetical protein
MTSLSRTPYPAYRSTSCEPSRDGFGRRTEPSAVPVAARRRRPWFWLRATRHGVRDVEGSSR